MANITLLQGIRDALEDEMAADDRVFLIGQDIGGYGGAFRVTAGLQERFGIERVVETPIAEAAVIGAAAGAANTPRDTQGLRRRLITSAACQAAIKVNYPLSRPAMQRLLDDLFRVENPTTCPHGRPALFRLSLDEIERAFRRR